MKIMVDKEKEHEQIELYRTTRDFYILDGLIKQRDSTFHGIIRSYLSNKYITSQYDIDDLLTIVKTSYIKSIESWDSNNGVAFQHYFWHNAENALNGLIIKSSSLKRSHNGLYSLNSDSSEQGTGTHIESLKSPYREYLSDETLCDIARYLTTKFKSIKYEDILLWVRYHYCGEDTGKNHKLITTMMAKVNIRVEIKDIILSKLH